MTDLRSNKSNSNESIKQVAKELEINTQSKFRGKRKFARFNHSNDKIQEVIDEQQHIQIWKRNSDISHIFVDGEEAAHPSYDSSNIYSKANKSPINIVRNDLKNFKGESLEEYIDILDKMLDQSHLSPENEKSILKQLSNALKSYDNLQK